MTTYKYLAYDLRSQQILEELPLYGTWFQSKLNGPGNCTFSTKLGGNRSNVLPDNFLLAATIPGRSALLVERNNQLIGAWIIWSRTYQSQAKSLSFTGQTLESYAYKRLQTEDLSYENVDGRNILRDLYLRMQSSPQGDIHINVPASFGELVPREFVEYLSTDFKFYGELVEELIAVETGGFDYRIEVTYTSLGVPQFNLLLGYPERLGVAYPAPSVPIFEYPGSIYNYYWPESTAEAANRLWVTGQGQGVGISSVQIDDTDNIAVGWPYLDKVVARPDTFEEDLANVAAQLATTYDMPMTRPTFEVLPQRYPPFGSYQLGDDALFKVKDARFPNGAQYKDRITGWELSPAGENGPESLKLIMEGSDELSEGVEV